MRQHPEQRLEILADSCGDRAWRVAATLLTDAHEAYDAVQQAYLVAARKVEQIPVGDPWPWFAAVVAFEARNMRRKKKPKPFSGMPEGALTERHAAFSDDPQTQAQNREESAAVMVALDGLPWKERESIVLTRVAGLSHDEAAAVLRMPRKTLTSHVQRGVARLRERTGRSDSSVGGALAVLPLALPPGGIESAVACWKAAAMAQVSGSVAAATVTTGGVFALNKLLVGTGMVLAVAAGAVGGVVLDRSAREEVAVRPATEDPRIAQNADEAKRLGLSLRDSEAAAARARSDADSAKADAERVARERDARISTLETEIADLRTELRAASQPDQEKAELRTRVEALQAELAPFIKERSEQAPVFTFGFGGTVDGVLNANWKEMAEASKNNLGALLRIHTARMEGKQSDRADHLILQGNVERMRKFEYRTLGKLPSFGRHNGELTHPISLANLVAAMLREANDPLSSDQVERITRHGEAWEGVDSAARKLYGESTPRTKKMLDEYSSKGVFVAAMMGELTPAQRAIVADPAIHGRAGLDLLCPTLMILHSSPVLSGKDIEGIKEQLGTRLARNYKLSEESQGMLRPLLDTWGTRVAGILAPVKEAESRNYTYTQGLAAGHATVELHVQMLNVLRLGDESKAALLADDGFFIPRIIAEAVK